MSSQMTYRQRVASEVRAEMARRQRLGKDLAELLGCSVQSASRRMNGHVPFDLDQLETVAQWLGLDPSALAAGKSAHEPAA